MIALWEQHTFVILVRNDALIGLPGKCGLHKDTLVGHSPVEIGGNTIGPPGRSSSPLRSFNRTCDAVKDLLGQITPLMKLQRDLDQTPCSREEIGGGDTDLVVKATEADRRLISHSNAIRNHAVSQLKRFGVIMEAFY